MSEAIFKLSNSYNEEIWNKYSNGFIGKTGKDSLIDIPYDISNVLIQLLGYEQAKEWIYKDIKDLDYNKAINLVKSEKGIKALKMYILCFPC